MRLTIHKDLGNLRAGDVICVPDENGIPLDKFWRRRLKDSEIDNCCSILIEEKEKPKTKKQVKQLETKGVK